MTDKYVQSIANVGIQTADLWCRKRLLYQLPHNHGLHLKMYFDTGQHWIEEAKSKIRI